MVSIIINPVSGGATPSVARARAEQAAACLLTLGVQGEVVLTTRRGHGRELAHAAALISTDDLARRMGAPGVRVFDCTTYLRPRTDGQPGYVSESGRANYNKGHIPGAAYLDLAAELSDSSSRLRYTLPPLDQLTKAFAAKGIGHGTFVVLYSHASPVWATRIWWMLRAVGFDDAVRDADLVVTGEGRLDAQTGGGKAVSGVVGTRSARRWR